MLIFKKQHFLCCDFLSFFFLWFLTFLSSKHPSTKKCKVLLFISNWKYKWLMSPGVRLSFVSTFFFLLIKRRSSFPLWIISLIFATSHFGKGGQVYIPWVTPSLHSCLNYFYSLAIDQKPKSKKTDKTHGAFRTA